MNPKIWSPLLAPTAHHTWFACLDLNYINRAVCTCCPIQAPKGVIRTRQRCYSAPIWFWKFATNWVWGVKLHTYVSHSLSSGGDCCASLKPSGGRASTVQIIIKTWQMVTLGGVSQESLIFTASIPLVMRCSLTPHAWLELLNKEKAPESSFPQLTRPYNHPVTQRKQQLPVAPVS